MNGPDRNRRGFTLVEMLVVVAVIAILVSIVVGVAGVVTRRQSIEQTKLSMAVIMNAVDKYRELHPQGNYPAEANDFSGQPATWKTRDWQAYVRGEKLYRQLNNAALPQVQARIAPLRKDGIGNVRGNPLFVDGFSKYMDYREKGGAGGRPVLISAGPDADFDKTEDNIRSDNR